MLLALAVNNWMSHGSTGQNWYRNGSESFYSAPRPLLYLMNFHLLQGHEQTFACKIARHERERGPLNRYRCG